MVQLLTLNLVSGFVYSCFLVASSTEYVAQKYQWLKGCWYSYVGSPNQDEFPSDEHAASKEPVREVGDDLDILRNNVNSRFRESAAQYEIRPEMMKPHQVSASTFI